MEAACYTQSASIQNSRPSTSENESASLLNYLDHVLDGRGRMEAYHGQCHGLSLKFDFLPLSMLVFECFCLF